MAKLDLLEGKKNKEIWTHPGTEDVKTIAEFW